MIDLEAKAKEVCSALDGIYATDYGIILVALREAFNAGKAQGIQEDQDRKATELKRVKELCGIPDEAENLNE